MPPYTVTSAENIEPMPFIDDLANEFINNLPYADQLNQEASDELNNITQQFALHIKAGDWAPGALFWAKQLGQYLDLKYVLPKEHRIRFARVFYELTIAPGMESALVELWCVYCTRLIKKEELIGPGDITFDWRPLYDILERTLYPKNRQRTLLTESYEKKRMTRVVNLVEKAQRFFPPEATAEILEEFLPKFTTSNLPELLKAQTYLVRFLPTMAPAGGLGPKDWLPTIFQLWATVVQSPTFDCQFLGLIGHVTKDNVNSGLTFTVAQRRAVFATAMRALDLPVGAGAGQHANVDAEAGTAHHALGRRGDQFHMFARFVIYSINPVQEDADGDSSYLASLSNFIQAIESFFHPSNYGKWTYTLSRLVQFLAWEYFSRIKEEEQPECKTPHEYRLTSDLNRRFVKILRGVMLQSMFSKDPRSISTAHASIRYLSWIEPKLIIPDVLEQIYPSLVSLTETHRTTSVISAAGALAMPLLNRENYPEGGKHLTSLLHLTLPGIDMNDPTKTMSTLVMVTYLLSSVPIFDQSDMGSEEFQWMGMEPESKDPEELTDVEYQDSIRKAATGEFEEWLTKFLGKIFVLFENFPDVVHGSSKKNTIEDHVSGTITYCLEVVFAQLSPALYQKAYGIVLDFMASNTAPNGGKALSLTLTCLILAGPKGSLKRALDICSSEIRSELESGASSVPSVAYATSHRDNALHYFQYLLNAAVLYAQHDILDNRTELMELIDLMLEKTQSRNGYKQGAKLINQVLETMTTVYPSDSHSFERKKWEDENFMKESHKHWGLHGLPGSDKVEWHVPSSDEIDFAIELIEKYHLPAMARVRELMATGPGTRSTTLFAVDLCKSLNVVLACVEGMSVLVEDDGDSPITLVNNDDSVQPLKRVIAGYALTDLNDPRTQNVRRIRHDTGLFLHEAMVYFMAHREDDIENIKVLIDATGLFLTDRGISPVQQDGNKRIYSMLKQAYQFPKGPKMFPRVLRIRRAMNQHLTRLRINSHGRAKTQLHDSLILDLTNLCLGQYADIRQSAQRVLTRTVRCLQGAKNMVLPILLKSLGKGEGTGPEIERMKGALYLMASKPFMMQCLRDWRFAPEYVLRLCSAHHADKPSIQALVRKNFMSYIMNMTSASFQVLISPALQNSIDEFVSWHPSSVDSTKLSRVTNKAQDRRLNTIKSHDNLMLSLLAIVQDPKLHWRYQTMAMSFMEMLVRPEIPISLEMAKFYTSSVLSEIHVVRRIAISTLSLITVFMKVRTFAQGDTYCLVMRKATNPLKRLVTMPDEIPKDFTEEYLQASVSEIDYDNPEASLLDDTISTGWLAWPKSYTVYLPRSDSFEMPETDPESKPAYDHLEEVFKTTEFWEKTISYMSQEPVNGERNDIFNSENARFYKSVFGMFEDRVLDSLKPLVAKLLLETDEKNSQRAAAELLGGLIRGSKHWTRGQLQGMWTWLTPVLKKALQQCTPNSLVYWERFVKYCCLYRDPRRILPLIRLIFGIPLDRDSTAAFSESKNLFFTRAVLVSLSWRVSLLTEDLRRDHLKNINHPYKQVREILGITLNELFQLTSHPSYSTVNKMLEDHQRLDGDTALTTTLDPTSATQVQEVLQTLVRWRQERDPSAIGASNYTNGSKTVLPWIVQILTGFRVQASYGILLAMTPEILQMQEVNEDQDLQHLASLTLLQLARFVYPAENEVGKMVQLLCDQMKDGTSWHIRLHVLPLIQIFYFNNLFSMNRERIEQVMDGVSAMLLDTRVEVRQLAATTLSGIVRCSQREAATILIERFKQYLKTPLAKRVRSKISPSTSSGTSTPMSSSSSSSSILLSTSSTKSEVPEGYNEAILRRHAGVLGLACLIEAYPYEVPMWMPEVMVHFAKFVSDPPPISTTVKKTFANFKRTHQDSWHEDAKNFDENQLEVLGDMLISPSYYA